MVSRNYVPFTIHESTPGVLGGDGAGNPTPGMPGTAGKTKVWA